MKQIGISLLTIALLGLSFTSCKKDNDPSGSTTSNIIQQGTWKITLYNNDGTDKTSNFNGYTFTFNANGVVNAVKAATTIPGTWNTGTDDSQAKLTLNFGSVSPFEEINEDWHILEKTTTKIRLEHVSGGGGGTDLLTFEKN